MTNGTNPNAQYAADKLAQHVLALLGTNVERGYFDARMAVQVASSVFCHAAAIAGVEWAECSPELEKLLAQAHIAVAAHRARLEGEAESKASIILVD